MESRCWVYPRVPKSLRFLAYGWRARAAAITWPFKMSGALCLEPHNLLQLIEKLTLCCRVLCMEGENQREAWGRPGSLCWVRHLEHPGDHNRGAFTLSGTVVAH